MLIPPDFKDIDLSSYSPAVRKGLTTIYGNNDSYYQAIRDGNLQQVRKMIDDGYPHTLKTSLDVLGETNKLGAKLFQAFDVYRDNGEIFYITNNFGNDIKKFPIYSYEKRQLIECLAEHYFKQKGFVDFKYYYFATAQDKKKVSSYIQAMPEFSRTGIEGLLSHPDSSYSDILLDNNQRISKDILMPQKLSLNILSYQKLFSHYLDEWIELSCSASAYLKDRHVINSLFSAFCLYAGDDIDVLNYLGVRYESLMHIDKDFMKLALAYDKIAQKDTYFVTQWHKKSDAYKSRISFEDFISSPGAQLLHKNYMTKSIKKFGMVLDEICEKMINEENSNKKIVDKIMEQCALLCVESEYYTPTYQKLRLDFLLKEKKSLNIHKL